MPSIDGTLNFDTSSGAHPRVTLTPINYLEYLNVPVMLAGEARKGNWSLFTDFVYVDFSGEKAVVKSVRGPLGLVQVPIDAGSSLGLRGTVWTLGGSYTAIRGPSATLDVLGGFRNLSVKASLDWQFTGGIGLLPASGSLSQTEHLWDAIVGVRGKVKLGAGNWFATYYLDVAQGPPPRPGRRWPGSDTRLPGATCCSSIVTCNTTPETTSLSRSCESAVRHWP